MPLYAHKQKSAIIRYIGRSYGDTVIEIIPILPGKADSNVVKTLELVF
jgi:hypothetical protein